MPDTKPAIIIEPEQLEAIQQQNNVLLIDLNKEETYLKYHIPGAVRLDYASIIRVDKPRLGLLPSYEALSQTFSAIGMTKDTYVIAYDDEGGGMASRLLWTLDVIGHSRFSLLNGGLIAWINEGHTVSTESVQANAGDYTVMQMNNAIADSGYIMQHLNDSQCALIDTRSPEEYNGIKKFAANAGHIPGAVNFNWTDALDINRNARLKDLTELSHTFEGLGITKEKEVITYCQSHHRSAHTYILLKHLGYKNIKGYPGSWSDWGNKSELPFEV